MIQAGDCLARYNCGVDTETLGRQLHETLVHTGSREDQEHLGLSKKVEHLAGVMDGMTSAGM